MINLLKKTENRRTNYLFPVVKLEDRMAILDATDAIRDAIWRDKKLGYAAEQGPNYGQEVIYADDYVRYVAEHATTDSLHKFNNPRRGWTFYLDTPSV